MLIKNATITNEGKSYKGSVLVKNDLIEKVFLEADFEGGEYQDLLKNEKNQIDASEKHLLPGIIDTQVHFRDPGLTHKADLYTESRAAVAGGITSFFEMPNTVPNVLTQELLEQKYEIAAEKSLANYSFYMGSSNDNPEEVLKTDPKTNCGIKIFLGASTGNMLVERMETLEKVFAEAQLPIATHCEDEMTIRKNGAKFKEEYGEELDIKYHPQLRSHEACYKSSKFATDLARKHGSRLHVLHLTTAKEMELFEATKVDYQKPETLEALRKKKITAEACVHHLWFSEEDYAQKGSFIKWNPAIKSAEDRAGLWQALKDGKLDIVATDHAPHTLEEKSNTNYFKCPAGGPLVQHSLLSMLEHYKNGKISLEEIVHKMCHAADLLFNIEKRGYIRPGYKADLCIVDLKAKPWKVKKSNVLYKCGWAPFEDVEFTSTVDKTIINGKLAFELNKDALYNDAAKEEIFKFAEKSSAQRVTFDR